MTSALYQPAGFGSRSAVAVTVGAVLSSLTVAEAVAELPALSVAVPETSVPLVSVLTVLEAEAGLVPSATQLLTPEPPALSAQAKVTVASVLFQPAALGTGDTLALIVGGVLSARLATTLVVAVLPAASVAVPVTVVPTATVLLLEAGLVPSATQLAIPEGWPPPALESSQVKVTVIVPSAFSVCVALIVGLALSTRTVAEPAALVLPRRSDCAGAVSVAMPFAVTVSVWNGCAAATPEPASVAVHLTVTSLLFQPAALATGVRAAVTTGPVLSRVYDPWADPLAPVQIPLSLNFSEAVAVTLCAPLPEPAVVVKVHADFAVADVWWPVKAPATSTQFVSLLVLTVRVTVAPCLA